MAGSSRFSRLIFEVFFLAHLIVLFRIVTDLIGDRSLSGVVMAVCVFCLVVFPMITALVYLVLRGRGMAARQHEAAKAAEEHSRQYIQSLAGSSPAQEIAEAKGMLDSGTISLSEFEHLESKALGA